MQDLFITFLASFLIWFMFAGLFVLWVIDGKIKKEQVLHALLATGIAWVLAELVKSAYPTVRPFVLDGTIPMVIMPGTDGAFPSAHAAAAFALGTTIWLHDKKVGAIFLIAAFIVGVARVVGNVHYPIDIIGGAVIGVVVTFLAEKVHLRKLIT